MGGMVFGPGALIAVGLYLVSMIGVGWIARTRRRSNSMADFYLAGRSMGLLVLFLTLYATQYSGNTLFGYTGKTYRIGFEWTASVLFMFSIIVGYMLFAPRLVALARKEGIYHPWRLHYASLPLVGADAAEHSLDDLRAGQLRASPTQGDGRGRRRESPTARVPGSYGIIGLAIIMVIYETLGGMRSVAWTDVMQGGVLLLGFGILVFIIPQNLGGGLGHVVAQLSEMDPPKVQAPSLEGANKWISYALLLGCGAAIYPQAIQRLYASRSVAVLKRSLTLMAFMPLTTTLVALICGLTAAVVLPDLSKAESDQVLARLCALVMGESALGYWLVVAIFAAVLAALMSTADSALLSISSMFTKDIYLPYFRPQATEAELTKVGKICSWVIVAVLVAVAIGTDATLVRLLELKFEVLIQVVPCFFLGLYWKRLSARTALLGMVCGLAVALGFTFGGKPMIWGFHAGVIGLGINAAVCAIGACCKPATSE